MVSSKVSRQHPYEVSHPWISFSLDLRRANYLLWASLGEAQSKCEHIAGVPLRPDVTKNLHQVFLAKGVMATTAIEGNTLSEEEVLDIVRGASALPPSKDYLRQEVDNIVQACNQIVKELVEGDRALTPERIMELNRRVLQDLAPRPEVLPGHIRTHSVTVGSYQGAPAVDCEFLLGRLCEWLNSDEFIGPPNLRIAFGMLKAIVAHIYLAWIHPFGDGNGRTARLVEFMVLLSVGVPTPAAHLLSNHYNLTRRMYYQQLDAASASGGDILPFIGYALEGLVDGLKEQLILIRSQQHEVAWRNYIHEEIKHDSDTVRRRRRHLMLALTDHPSEGFIPLSSIPMLSPEVAADYANKSRNMLFRDLAALEEEKFILRTPGGVKANTNLTLAFLPLRLDPPS